MSAAEEPRADAGGLTLTASATVGPFFAIGLTQPTRPAPLKNVLADENTPGQRIRVEGVVLDGDGAPIPDAMLEVWQADAEGCYAHPASLGVEGGGSAFNGFGRAATDDEGRYWFETIKPGGVGAYGGVSAQAPHLVLTIFMRGLLNHVVSRVYFEDEGGANAADPVLALVPADRRGTLIARREQAGSAGRETVYRFDLRMQGPGETVFFQV